MSGTALRMVATAGNLTALLVSLSWVGFGIVEVSWALIVIFITAFITLFM